MPRFRPFAGLRYDKALPLAKVIAPPYDVVSPEQRAVLAARHRANAIHVELPVQDTRTGLDKYRSAAQIFATWREDGVLVPERGPAFYAYRMTGPGGSSTTGVIGALECEAPGGDILPHEQTIPKDKSDRLDLLRACRANLSPIWGLSLARGLSAAYEPDGPPLAEAVDDDGVTHALWVLDTPEALEAIERGVAGAPVVIADGHHRYETALAYQAERRAGRDGAPGDYDLVMALVVELAEGQLSVGPIHRTLSAVPPEVDLAALFGRWFDTVHAGSVDGQLVEAVAESGALALVTHHDVWLLTPRADLHRGRLGPRLEPGGPGHRRPARRRCHLRPRLALGGRRGVGRRGPGPGATAARDRRPDLGLGARPPAHATQEHLLLPEAPHRDGLQARRGLSGRRPRNTDAAALPPSSQRDGCELRRGALFLYPP